MKNCKFRFLTIAGIIFMGLSLNAQPERQELGFDRPESWAMKYFASVELLNGFGPPEETTLGELDLGLEVSQVPYLKAGYRRVGFNGTKKENLNKAPVLIRPRVDIGLTRRLSATVSYVPPIEVFDNLETHLVGISINYLLYSGDTFQVGLRLIGQWNEATGDFTCPEEAVRAGLDDQERNPYRCEEVSSDTFEALTGTVELSVGYSPERLGGTRFFATVMYNQMDLEFEVDAHYNDFEDHRRLLTDGHTFAYTGGVSIPLTDKIGVDIALMYAPLDVVRQPDAGLENDSLLHLRTQVIYAF